jgi:mRNA interferase RelE/StbE
MSYNIIIPKPVQKQLKPLSQEIYQRVTEKILQLSNEPRPIGVKKLQGFENEYRIATATKILCRRATLDPHRL